MWSEACPAEARTGTGPGARGRKAASPEMCGEECGWDSERSKRGEGHQLESAWTLPAEWQPSEQVTQKPRHLCGTPNQACDGDCCAPPETETGTDAPIPRQAPGQGTARMRPWVQLCLIWEGQGLRLSMTQSPAAQSEGPAHLFGCELPASLVHVLNLNIGLVAILLLEVLGEATVLLPPAVLVINGPGPKQGTSMRAPPTLLGSWQP